ncbi:MAG: glycosyltransferase family 39 protein [Phycisphaerales bacterium]
MSTPLLSLLMVIALGAALYLPFLGYAGFTQSEGFRVFPAWHMLHSGDWLVTRLFEQPYLRKPPGMPWAIAAMSFLFGENEWAARSVSGFSMILGGVLCWWAARRWYGSLWYAPLAGLAYLAAPMFWADPGPGRAAEIEALHNLCVLAAMVLIIDLTQRFPVPNLVARASGPCSTPSTSLSSASLFSWHTPALALSLASAFLVKGPSGLPAIGGLLFACLLLTRRWKLLVPLAVSTLLAGGAVLWWYLSLKAAIAHLSPPPVREPSSQFLWTPGKELKVLLLPIAALGAGLPFTLAPMFVLTFSPREATPGRILSLGCLLGIGFYTLLGVSNHRYVMPALTLAPLAFPACLHAFSHGSPRARQLGGLLQLTRPGLIIAVLTLAAALYTVRLEIRKDTRTSGKAAGLALGDTLAADVKAHTPPGQPAAAEIWGDEYIDTRPEVLWYARRQAAANGVTLRVRWTPGLDKSLALPPPGNYLIVRVDDGKREFRDPEWPALEKAGVLQGIKPVAEGTAHVFTFRVFRVGMGVP